jgi:hypothetical protein
MSGSTSTDSGLASGLINTAQQVGGALGTSILATLAATRTETLLAGGATTASALTHGYRLAFLVAAASVGAAIVVALVVARTRHPSVRQDLEPEKLEVPEPAPV